MKFEIETSNSEILRYAAEFLSKAAAALEPDTPVRPARPAKQVKPVPAETPAPAPAEAPVPAEAPAPAPAEAPVKQVTLELVRAVLKAKADGGKRVQVQELVASYGVSNLTQIPADKLAEVLAKGGAL